MVEAKSSQSACKQSFPEEDRDKVVKFMQLKKQKAKEQVKKQEEEMAKRKETIKQRLLALEMKRREHYVSINVIQNGEPSLNAFIS